MDQPHPRRPSDVLPEPLATKVLARASELEAARRAGASIEDLRAAAMEAGISESAFEEALGEVRSAVPDVPRTGRVRIGLWATVATVALLLMGFFVMRITAPTIAVAPVAETFQLRCMPANEAASMLRPILARTGTISFSMRVPTELTITGTPEQLQQARDILAERDVPGSPSCTLR